MRTCKCPECGAEIEIDDTNRDFGFCQYCGAKIMLDDFRSTQRYVDEARIKEDETNRILKIKELEIKERDKNIARKALKYAGIAAVVGAVLEMIGVYSAGSTLLLGALIVAVFSFDKLDDNNEKQKENDNDDKVPNENGKTETVTKIMVILTTDAFNYCGRHYNEVAKSYETCGFKNIRIVNMRDLKFGIFNKIGSVDSVTINGTKPEEKGTYDIESTVIINYHGFA
jgi:DNA-directed RNA polymerase subunit RPC12/RpoP